MCWKLFNYKHSRPDPTNATAAQQAAFAEFEGWRNTMIEVQLDAHWTKVFKAMAEAKAEEQEWQAQQARFLTWIDWLHDGPVYGLRKQHQLTKVKGEWVEASIVDCRQLSEAEIQIEDGVLARAAEDGVAPCGH